MNPLPKDEPTLRRREIDLGVFELLRRGNGSRSAH